MRADDYLSLKGFFDSRTKAKQAILNGEVSIDGKKVLKASKEITENEPHDIAINKAEAYVSLGGYKLAKALRDFNLTVKNKTVADIGASTGGFTDCLLQNGAQKVYAVDLSDNLLHKTLKENDKVVLISKNAKNLTKKDLPNIDVLTADLSFISAKLVLSVFFEVLPNNGYAILLIKPQFEIGEKRKFKNGIIKDEKIRKAVCFDIYNAAIETGFFVIDMTTAPINKDKNVEFLILLAKNGIKSAEFESIYKF